MDWQAAPEPRLRIVLPGGSGYLGETLARHFQASGHHVTVLTRSPYAAPWLTVHWDGEEPGLWVKALEGADVCLHLSGRGMRCRWNEANRQAIAHSRLHTTELVGRAIGQLRQPPRLWINASTADIYRHATDRAMDEATGELGGYERISRFRHAPAKWNFAARVARDWESAFFAAETPATRKVALRSGLVMGAAGGSAFATYSRQARMGLGGPQGSGRQYVSWIHEADFVRAVEFLMANEQMAGPVNVAAPNPVRNREFMAALREAWETPNGVPAPWPIPHLAALVLRTETELTLKSRRVAPGRLLEAGFEFEYPDWAEAAENLVGEWRREH